MTFPEKMGIVFMEAAIVMFLAFIVRVQEVDSIMFVLLCAIFVVGILLFLLPSLKEDNR